LGTYFYSVLSIWLIAKKELENIHKEEFKKKRDREAPRVDSLPAGLDVADLVQKAIAATIASMHLAHQAPPVGDLAAVAEVMGKRYRHLQVLTDSVKTLARNEELWYPHLWFHRVVQDGKSAVTE
jgi:hypothetical protein